MKTTLLVAMFAVIGLTACEKTTVNPPATTVVNPTVEKQVAVPVAVLSQCLFQARLVLLAPLAPLAMPASLASLASLATP